VSNQSYFANYFSVISSRLGEVDSYLLEEGAQMIASAADRGGKIIAVGNGGSAAMASHVSVDFTKAARVRSINYNEADLITCFANDYGYEHWVEEAMKAYADPIDLAILISSSGTSKNIINGAKAAKSIGLEVLTFSGFSSGNPLRALGDINYWVESDSFNVIEMTHHIWLVAMVDYLVEKLR